MPQVFISYSKDDGKVAEHIADELRKAGVKVFDDRELAPGEDFEVRLAHELKRAAYVLLLLSPSYLKSPWASKELEAAALSESEGGARLLPILLTDTPIPPFLRSRIYVDFRENPEVALERLRRLITTAPRQLEPSRTRRSRRAFDLLSVLLSLLGAAGSAMVSVVGWTSWRIDLPLLGAMVGVAAVLTGLVAALSRYRPHRRSRPIELVASTVEHAYLDALDASSLNPLRIREAQHG